MNSILLLLSLICQTPAVPVSDAVTFWSEQKTPVPAPIPISPDAATILKPGERCVFGSDVELFYRCIPEGVVKVKRAAGPKTYIYTDDKGEDVEKTFASKFLLSVTPNPLLKETTRCQLVICPKGVTDDKKIVVKLIEAQVGSKPPPVDPIDPPKPEPSTIAKKAIAWYAAVKSPTKQMEGQLIRSVFYVMATQDAGKFKTLEEFGTEIRNRCRGVVADANEAAWREAFFTPLMAELEKSAKTVADCERICADLAAGLKEVVK